MIDSLVMRDQRPYALRRDRLHVVHRPVASVGDLTVQQSMITRREGWAVTPLQQNSTVADRSHVPPLECNVGTADNPSRAERHAGDVDLLEVQVARIDREQSHPSCFAAISQATPSQAHCHVCHKLILTKKTARCTR